MDKPITAIEITTNAVKLVVGYELDGRAIVLDSLSTPLSDAVVNGEVVDPALAGAAINKLLKQVTDDLGLVVSEVAIVLPPIGLDIFLVEKTTTVLNGKVGRIDLQNVIQLAKNEDVGEGNEIVGLAPDMYILDQKRAYLEPPLNEMSQMITLRAKIHVLRKSLVDGYRKIGETAHVKIPRFFVAPFCAAEVVKGYPEMPRDYILFDFGARFSTISLIGDTQLYGSTFVHKGSDQFTDQLMSGLKLTFAEATKLKETYGIDRRATTYKAPIAEIHDEAGRLTSYAVDEVNAILEKGVAAFAEDIRTCISDVLAKYDASFQSLPVVIIGGGSRMNGLIPLLKEAFAPRDIFLFTPKAMGARSGTYTNTLGLIKVMTRLRSNYDDERRLVAQVEREEAPVTNGKNARRKRGDAYEEEL